ncbi:MAG: hypothetical protein C4520_00170 [Candidatus Abyssobacteria bacterium SURF_5]|uniref:Sulfatase N-terminal domain-containing protein n=1 Tax=Abyssobacteria bacterium (strain SURF_5) TaxID=2093360 RepID=A0A3A4P7G6_ABYX5|nr:MAG: hypothetical protein C4520_00170 [Candidatus Abyssubacteria bacterium SURF_5]
MSLKKITAIHPFLFAAAPIVFLWSHNSQKVEFVELLLPALVSVGACALLLGVLWLVSRDWARTAATVSLLLLLFFGYGHLFELIWSWNFFQNVFVAHLVLGIYLAVFFAGTIAAVWRARNIEQLTVFFTIAPAVILLISPVTIFSQVLATYEKQPEVVVEPVLNVVADPRQAQPKAAEPMPDIYYIILDSYSRADSLKQLYGYDNSSFIDFLKSRGFYIADQSFSNYPNTIYSLSSSLNLHYLKDGMNENQLLKMLREPLIARYLQSKGYRYVHFNTFASETRKSDIADVTYDYTPLLGREFTRILLRTTLLSGLEKYGPTRLLAEHTLYLFDNAGEIPHISAPTFTLAHFFPPHHPFIFDSSGNYIGDDQPMTVPTQNVRSLYVDQLIFMNDRTKLLIDQLLKRSSTPPIIIIQGDHGGGYMTSGRAKEWDRLGILNAYYVPENYRQELYNTITPVNSFRLLVKSCFNENLKRLPDVSYVVKDEKFVKSEVAARGNDRP